MNTQIAIFRNLILTFVIACFALSTQAGSAANKKITELIPVYKSGNLITVKRETGQLAWAGISSPRLFDVVEARLKENVESSSKEGMDLTGWLIKALSYSGNPKYLPTLENIAQTSSLRKVKGYAKKGIDRLHKYEQWNPELRKGVTASTDKEAEFQRVRNMLKSDNYELLRMGAKRVAYRYRDNSELLALVQKRLLGEYQSDLRDKVSLDTMIWLCKALAESGNSKYKSILDQVANGTDNRKLAKRAAKYAAVL